MQIRILGPGCRNCAALEARTREALTGLGVAVELVKVDDLAEIASYGVLRTPGLVVDGQLVVSGRVPTTAELRELLAAPSEA